VPNKKYHSSFGLVILFHVPKHTLQNNLLLSFLNMHNCKSVIRRWFTLKKLYLIVIALILIFTLNGCKIEHANYINFSVKPNNHYYTDKLKKQILNNNKFTLYVFDTNLYKEIEVPSEENPVIEDFLSSLVDDNYSNEQIDIKEAFRLTIVFKNTKYLIKVFDDSVISISPWDGTYKEDILSIKELPLRYNLFDFCNHIANKPLSK
jgi:hypothetical protein